MARTARFKDLTGQRFGKIVVLSHVTNQKWNCKCDCGNEKVLTSTNLASSKKAMCRSCYQKSRIIDLTERRFGKWTVISFNRPGYWNCRCDCGNESVCAVGNLRGGRSTQCYDCRIAAMHPEKHGHASGNGCSITYTVWASIKQRCGTKFSPYGGNGICICEGWKNDFSKFLESMGERPSVDVSIDRDNKDESTRHYSCGKCEECIKHGWVFHCRWATQGEQMRNTSRTRWLTFNGETLVLSDWATKLGMSPGTLSQRIDKYGWSVERALSTPRRTYQ